MTNTSMLKREVGLDVFAVFILLAAAIILTKSDQVSIVLRGVLCGIGFALGLCYCNIINILDEIKAKDTVRA